MVERLIKNNLKENETVGSDKYNYSVLNHSANYIKTIIETAHEPMIVLDKKLFVITANESFYRTFKVNVEDTENKSIYELGDGQWNIPQLKKLLENILPKNTFFNGFEVINKFPLIGHKIIILNARQIHFESENEKPSEVILLAIEDLTDIMGIAETFTDHVKNIETRLNKKTAKIEESIIKLEKDLKLLKNI